MVKTKKVLCLVLSVVMLFSCFMISSFAAVGSGKSIGFRLEADKTTVNPGDTITYTLYVDLADPSVKLANFIIFFSYNNTQFVAPTKDSLARTWLNDFAGYYSDTSLLNVANLHNALKAKYTAEETALYNAAFQIQGTVDGAKGSLAEGMAITSSTTAQMTFKMVVADSVAPGTKVSLGISPAGFKLTSRGAMLAYANGTSTPSKYTEADLDFTEATATATGASAGPALNHLRRELKMDVQDGAVVKGSEQLRVVSSISTDDWNEYFANTTTKDATTDKITEVGIVAFKGQADAFNVDTAKAVAQDPANAPEGYSAAKTDYIQNDTAGKTGAYLFGALIKYQSAPFDTTYIAYVKYLNNAGVEAYAFYDTTTIYSVNFATNYQTLTDDYVAWLATQA